MLHAAGKLLLEGCSVEGLPLLVHYVKETINGSEAVSESGATGRLGLVQGVIDALNVVQHHRVIEVLKSEIEQLPKIEGRLFPFQVDRHIVHCSIVLVHFNDIDL